MNTRNQTLNSENLTFAQGKRKLTALKSNNFSGSGSAVAHSVFGFASEINRGTLLRKL